MGRRRRAEGNPADLPEPRSIRRGLDPAARARPGLGRADRSRTSCRPTAWSSISTSWSIPGFTEDKWVKASQIIPGSAPAVHHVLCFVRPPGRDRGSIDENGLGFLAAYVPGYRADAVPRRHGQVRAGRLEAGFPDALHAVGKEQTDLSKIGFIFAKPEELTHMVQTVSTGNHGINIPPHAEDYKPRSDDERVQARPDGPVVLAAHARPRQGVLVRSDLSRRQARNAARHPAIRLQLADELRAGRGQDAAAGHARALRGPLGQLGEQPGQSRSCGHGQLGRSDVRRDDDRLLRRGDAASIAKSCWPTARFPSSSRPPRSKIGPRS